jgi:hypothetical protein
MRSTLLIGLIAVLSAATMPVFAGELVTNGGFEIGDLAGWTQTGWGLDLGDVVPNSGDHFAGDGCTDPGCLLSQALTTDAGAYYDLNFWYNSGSGIGNQLDLKVSWDGVQIDDIVGNTNDIVGNTNGYANFDYIVQASAGGTVLQFEGLTITDYQGIDDVSVTTMAPEPGSITLLIAGLAAIVVRKRRRA